MKGTVFSQWAGEVIWRSLLPCIKWVITCKRLIHFSSRFLISSIVLELYQNYPSKQALNAKATQMEN